MPEIKRIFDEKHKICNVKQISKYENLPYRLGSIPNPIVYSVDCLFDKHRKLGGGCCDEFIFFELNNSISGIYLIERKTNSQNMKKVCQQLNGGAKFIENFLKNDPASDGEPFDFMPICVSKGLKKSTSKKLLEFRVSLCNKSKRITHVQNNRTLPNLK